MPVVAVRYEGYEPGLGRSMEQDHCWDLPQDRFYIFFDCSYDKLVFCFPVADADGFHVPPFDEYTRSYSSSTSTPGVEFARVVLTTKSKIGTVRQLVDFMSHKYPDGWFLRATRNARALQQD